MSEFSKAALSVPGPQPSPAERSRQAPPKGFEPGTKYDPTSGLLTEVITPPIPHAGDAEAWTAAVEAMGVHLPDGYVLRLVEAKYDPAAWHRDNQGEDAVTRPVWRYRFAVELRPELVTDDDLTALYSQLRAVKRKPKTPPEASTKAVVVVWADLQVGKTDTNGGTDELVARVADRLDRLDEHLSGLKGVTEAYFLDAGDVVENFNNVRSQAQTNDLTLTRQVRVARRLTSAAIERLAARYPRVVCATCGSNHCQVRVGKDLAADPLDDWGIEIFTQIADGMAHNPDAFGHVSFVFPQDFRDSVALDVAGKIVGLAHGHQAPRGDIVAWWRGQRHGKQPVRDADILVTGHFHHLIQKATGKDSWWFQAPSLDNGSAWYANSVGDDAAAGLLTFTVSAEHRFGWDDWKLI